MSRALGAVAILVSAATASGTPVTLGEPPIAVEVEGAESETHHLILFMGASSGPFGDSKCLSGTFALYDDGRVYFTRKPPDCRTMQAKVDPQLARSLVDLLVDFGFAALPHRQFVAVGTDQPSLSIMLRHGRRWHSASAYGLTRFGEVTQCCDEWPNPRLVGAVMRLTGFDVADAVEWRPEEFAIWFRNADQYPPSQPLSQESWPDEIPMPALDANKVHQTLIFDAQYLPMAQRLTVFNMSNFVVVSGKTWGVSVYPVFPEHEYRERVRAAVSAREWEMQEAR